MKKLYPTHRALGSTKLLRNFAVFFLLIGLLAFLPAISFAQAPVISGFSPANGPVGTAVTITGSGFNATAVNDIVFFGATKATVTTASTTNLSVTVPVGASYAPITVLNKVTGLIAYSIPYFRPTFTPVIDILTANAFSPGIFFATGGQPGGVNAIDVDGDGKPDVVVSNYDDGTVSILRNTSTIGNISFAPQIVLTVGRGPATLVIADIDGDGKPDIVTSNTTVSTVSILINTSTPGNISFAAPVNETVGNFAITMVDGDIDGDGKVDIITSNNHDNTISILRNTSTPGNVSFEPRINLTTLDGPWTVAISDMDNDGKLDLAAGEYQDATISIYRNTSTPGHISFATRLDLQNIPGTEILSFGDIDGDGKADLVSSYVNGTTDGAYVLRNTGSAGNITFAAGVFLPNLGTGIDDISGDGKPELFKSVDGYLNNLFSMNQNTSSPGNISFNPNVDINLGGDFTYPGAATIDDIDGDGKPDIITANRVNNICVLRNNIIPAPRATLSNISITGSGSGTLTPGFDPNHIAYTDTVANDVAMINIIPIAPGANYTIHVKGHRVSSGTAISVHLPYVGRSQAITIKAKAPGKELVTYTIAVLRVSRNANLTNLKISEGTLSPAFSPHVSFYKDTVTKFSTVRITPTAPNDAKITVNGLPVQSGNPSAPITLKLGDDNIIHINVTAQDGKSTRDYHITVRHPYISFNTQLDTLILSSGTLSPAFTKPNLQYTATVSNATTSIQVTPVSHTDRQTIKINGVPVTSGSPSAAIPLAVGNTEIDVVVTSQRIYEVRTYSIIVTRAASSDMAFSAAATDSAAHQATAVMVYPNPSLSTFSLKISNGDVNSGTTVTIMNLQGKIVYQQKGSVNDIYTFGQNFAIGIYIAEITNGKFEKQVKLIKAVQ